MTTIVLTANTESALQKALNTANAGDIITFSTAGVITLTQTLVISNSITIDGLVGSSSTVTLQGNGGFTDVEVISGTVTLSNLSITMGSGTGFSGTNGTASSVQGGNGGDAAGGVFIYGGQVTINSVGFSNDTAIGGNGGNGYSWADFSGKGGGGGGAGGNAAGAVFAEAGSVTFTGTSTFASDTATGGDGGAGGIGAGAYLDTSGNSPSSSYGGFGGSAGTGVANATGNAGVDGQAGNALGGTTGANGGTGGIPGAAGSAGSAGTGQNSLGGGGGGGGGGGTGYATIGASQNATIVPCFASGVRILTPSGYVPVEDLVEGGRVVTVSGATRPIIWLGHRRLDLTTHAAPESVQPICVQAHAFGPNLPLRPVTLSAEHAVYMLGVLVPVSALVNGSTIAPIPMREVTYWHVELDSHDAILADGLPCESYLDNGNRADFEGDQVITLHPMLDAARARFAALRQFAPLHRQGETVEQVRDILWRFDTGRKSFAAF